MTDFTPHEIEKFKRYIEDLEENVFRGKPDDLVEETMKVVFAYIKKNLDIEMKFADFAMSKAMDK